MINFLINFTRDYPIEILRSIRYCKERSLGLHTPISQSILNIGELGSSNTRRRTFGLKNHADTLISLQASLASIIPQVSWQLEVLDGTQVPIARGNGTNHESEERNTLLSNEKLELTSLCITSERFWM